MFLEICPFHLVYLIHWLQLLIILSYNLPFISYFSDLNVPPVFMVTFPVWIVWWFSVAFLFSIAFISALTLYYFFPFSCLGWFCFSSFLQWKVRLLIADLFFFLNNKACTAIKFPVTTALKQHSTNFDMFSHFCSSESCDLLVISYLTYGCLGVYCLIPTYLWIFHIFLCYWFLVSLHCGPENVVYMISIFLIYLDLFYGISVYIWEEYTAVVGWSVQ